MTDQTPPRRLMDLAPRWCLAGRWDDADGTQHFLNGDITKRSGMGLTFNCPVHGDHRLGVFFANPIDGMPPAADMNYLWQREGEQFDNLTLSPSIDASEVRHNGEICWHGFIRNGEIQ